MGILSFLRPPFFHRNGVVQEVPEDASSSGEIQPIEAVQVQEPVTRPEQDGRSIIIEELERIERLVLTDFGVLDVRVSVKTNPERRRIIQLLVYPIDRYKKSSHFQKLERRLTSQVSVRTGIPRSLFQVRKMRIPSQVKSPPE